MLPAGAIESIVAELLRKDGAAALQYSTTEGIAELRETIAGHMRAALRSRGGGRQVLVTTGSQQALDLAGKIFLDEGDALFCESPTYLAAISAFRGYGPQFITVPSDDEGMIPAALEAAVARHERRKLVYVCRTSRTRRVAPGRWRGEWRCSTSPAASSCR